ncbi:MAG: aryl-sulfate sulfotransferase, partial [Bacilli bacterium]
MIKISGKNKNIVILGSTILIALLVVLGAASYNIYQDKVKEERKQEYSFIFEGSKDPLSDRGTGSFQSKIDKKLKDDFDSNHYSLEKAKVVVNPYEISPLTALIMFETDKETAVTLTITGLHNDDIVKTFTKTKKHFVPVYGLYANKETKVTIKLDNGKTNSFLIKGGEVPKTAKEMTVLDNKVKLNNEMYLFTSPTGVPNIAYDNYGNVRWYLNMGYSKGVTVLRNGNLLLSNEKMGQDPTSNGGAVEVNLLGKVYNEYEIKGGYHHDAIELPSDNLLIPTTNIESGRTSDFIVEIDRKTGKEVNSFDLFDMINKIDPEYAKTLSSVWAWNNSVFYNKNTNELLVSLRNRNAIISIDYTKKTINWILSDPKNFSNKFESYLLKPTGKDFIYPFG